MKSKTIYTLLTVLLIIATFAICYNKYNSVSENQERESSLLSYHKNFQKRWQGNLLKYPDSILELNSNIEIKEFLGKVNKEYLVVSYLDADCSDCVNELKEWDEFLKTPNIKNNVNTLFIAVSSGIEMFKYQVNDQAKFEHPVFFDKKNEFKILNNISDKKVYQTFLLKDNKIVYVGSPMKGDLFKQEFIDLIK